MHRALGPHEAFVDLVWVFILDLVRLRRHVRVFGGGVLRGSDGCVLVGRLYARRPLREIVLWDVCSGRKAELEVAFYLVAVFLGAVVYLTVI